MVIASRGEQTGNVGWHQDYGYWRASLEPNLTTATIALTDQTPENGVISAVPGSHQRGVLNASDFFNQNLDETQQKIDVVKQRLIKYFGYNETSATDVLNYVASIFARGDSKQDE